MEGRVNMITNEISGEVSRFGMVVWKAYTYVFLRQ
jgi:hypothetical protein